MKRGLLLSRRLHTLRDMCPENYIDPKDLSKVKLIGGGAFATGEHPFCWICAGALPPGM